jgi:predicted nucleic acid-binding protein
MMFWDSSALVPLLIQDTHTTEAARLLGGDSEMTVWCATPIECEGAFARSLRRGGLDAELVSKAEARLQSLQRIWQEIDLGEAVRQTARRLIRIHDLRAADSQQLAAALTACDQQASTLPFACFDRRLRQAARAEGFRVFPEELK